MTVYVFSQQEGTKKVKVSPMYDSVRWGSAL